MAGVAIRWCESEVRDFEWSNTLSNGSFLVAALAGLRIARRRRLPATFLAAEAALVIVFAGSVAFHATAGGSWFAELLDEIPMGLLAFTYLLTVKDVHAWTRPPHWRSVLWAGGGGAFAGYGVYVYRRDHAIFSLIFTAQCLLAGLLAVDAGKALAVPRGTWFAFLGLILTGKVIWEYERRGVNQGGSPRPPRGEMAGRSRRRRGRRAGRSRVDRGGAAAAVRIVRGEIAATPRPPCGPSPRRDMRRRYERHLYRTDACPATATDPRFWCHALWHVFSAAAHHAAMVYHGDLWVAWDSKRRK